jgi:hypothetical protein
MILVFLQMEIGNQKLLNFVKWNKEKFENWKVETEQWRKDIKEGKRTAQDFFVWLNESK